MLVRLRWRVAYWIDGYRLSFTGLDSKKRIAMTNWTEMSEFDGVDLTESYVLGWRMVGDELRFDLDVALVPGHPAYHPPRLDERTCWHRGALTFPRTHDVIGLERQEVVRGGTDASGERDYGNIDTFVETDGEFRLCGEFGDVRLRSARPVLDLRTTPRETTATE